jgi:hypothetical protein
MFSLRNSIRNATALVWTCLALTINADATSERMLFHFQSATNSAAWQIVNDDVMGGVSTSQFQILTNGTAVFSGVVWLEIKGGFASVRSSPVRQNLNDTDAFVLRVRGDGRRYKFNARTETGFDTPNYQAEFTAKRGEWEEHRLAFKDFVQTFRGRALADMPPLNPTKIASVGFLISDQQEGIFKLEVAWVKASAPTGK